MVLIDRGAIVRLTILAVVLIVLLAWGWFSMIRMPGRSYRGHLPALTHNNTALAMALKKDIVALATDVGPRNMETSAGLAKAARFVEQSFKKAGYDVERQGYEVNGQTCDNLIAEIRGSGQPQEIVIVGAHYDSVAFNDSPGANDNGSGVAALLALARQLEGLKPARTLRFVAFVNEEPPYFQTRDMGSWVYARRCRQRHENVVAMLSLETIGYYSDKPGSQQYPGFLERLYPKNGNFVAFVGDLSSRRLVRQVITSFRKHARFPSEGIAAPRNIPGIGWSDHWSFWQEGYPALMVTDTAVFRYPYYHKEEDTPDKIDFARTAQVVEGLAKVIEELSNPVR